MQLKLISTPVDTLRTDLNAPVEFPKFDPNELHSIWKEILGYTLFHTYYIGRHAILPNLARASRHGMSSFVKGCISTFFRHYMYRAASRVLRFFKPDTSKDPVRSYLYARGQSWRKTIFPLIEPLYNALNWYRYGRRQSVYLLTPIATYISFLGIYVGKLIPWALNTPSVAWSQKSEHCYRDLRNQFREFLGSPKLSCSEIVQYMEDMIGAGTRYPSTVTSKLALLKRYDAHRYRAQNFQLLWSILSVELGLIFDIRFQTNLIHRVFRRLKSMSNTVLSPSLRPSAKRLLSNPDFQLLLYRFYLSGKARATKQIMPWLPYQD